MAAAMVPGSSDASTRENPRFDEFVEYLLRTEPDLMDKHWAPYSEVGTALTNYPNLFSFLCIIIII